MNKRKWKKKIKKQRLKILTDLFWIMQKHTLEKIAADSGPVDFYDPKLYTSSSAVAIRVRMQGGKE